MSGSHYPTILWGCLGVFVLWAGASSSSSSSSSSIHADKGILPLLGEGEEEEEEEYPISPPPLTFLQCGIHPLRKIVKST